MDDFFEAGLVDRDLALPERLDFALVVIDADDVVADVGEAGAGDEADITGADDGEIHVEFMKSLVQRAKTEIAKSAIANSAGSVWFVPAGIEVQIETEFRKRLEGESEEDAVFLHPAVVADDRAERRDPARQVAINRVALLLDDVGVASYCSRTPTPQLSLIR